MANTAAFRHLLGENLAQLSFEQRQAIAQCLIRHVIVTGEAVDIHFILPFATTPQAARRLPKEPEGTPGHFYQRSGKKLTTQVGLSMVGWLPNTSWTGRRPSCHTAGLKTRCSPVLHWPSRSRGAGRVEAH